MGLPGLVEEYPDLLSERHMKLRNGQDSPTAVFVHPGDIIILSLQTTSWFGAVRSSLIVSCKLNIYCE